MNRDQAFAALRQRGVAKAVVSFSGGNDEGGVNDITLLDASGETLQHDLPTYTYGKEGEDVALSEALGEPVYDQYGSFSGEFDVDGEVIWGVETREVRMSKEETEWVHSEEVV